MVNDTLYVCLQPSTYGHKHSLLQPIHPTNHVKEVISSVYMAGSHICQNLDIQVLLSHISRDNDLIVKPYDLRKEVGVFLTDSVNLNEQWTSKPEIVIGTIEQNFIANVNSNCQFHFLNVGRKETIASNDTLSESLPVYRNVVVGGTFDRLHSGHKSLLTECCLRCENKLTVGITDGERNKKKSLWELMQTYTERKSVVENFLSDVKPTMKVETAQIYDPFGPTITDPDLQCIVVSEETKAGGEAVNTERKKRNFPELDIVTIGLVDDMCHSEDEEVKVSSSSGRKRLLGTLLKPLSLQSSVDRHPYRVAVTGGIASGKSNVCAELEALGAKIINCDLLGHKAYEPGSPTFHAIVAEFGSQVVGEDGSIDRRQLGSQVFADKSKLEKLNSIVWPAIRELAEAAIMCHKEAGAPLVVIEAAVLFEAGWEDMAHEVWVTFVPREEAVSRLQDRNNLSNEAAQQRIDSQMSNTDRIARSNVVICPLWEKTVTRKQIEKAWGLLQTRINGSPVSNSTNYVNKL